MIGKSSFMYKFGACTFSESDLLSLNGVLRKNLLIDAQMRARKVILRSQRSTECMHMEMSLAEEH